MKRHMHMLLLILVAVICNAALAQTEFDWRAHEGQSIDVQLTQNIFARTIEPLIPEFEELTGISVDLEVLPEDQSRDRVRVELQAGSSDLDVFWGEPSRFGRMFVDNNWYEPLDRYIADPSLSSPELGWPDDFMHATVDGVIIDGQIVGIPVDRQVAAFLSYRKDILDELGIEVPKTYDELNKAIAEAHEGTPDDVYGITLRGRGSQTTSHFAVHLAEFGGAWEDENGNPTIDTPEAIAAFKWYGDVLREYGPPGAANMPWPDSNAIFLGGRAAFTIERSVNAGRALDPELSVIGDHIGFAPLPVGPGGTEARSNEPCKLPAIWSLSMSSFSTQKEAAWYFIQWATSTEAQIAYLKSGRPAARDSAFFSEEFEDYRSENLSAYWDVLFEANETTCYKTPEFAPPSIVDQGRARDIIGEVVVTAILGGNVEAAARNAQEELEMLKARQ
ncbi:MAG: sugar ABC transporter substrate-binding protein [Trueperaceae bacterium]